MTRISSYQVSKKANIKEAVESFAAIAMVSYAYGFSMENAYIGR